MPFSSTSTPVSPSHPQVQDRVTRRLSEFPWWVLVILLAAVLLVYNFATNATYQDIIIYLSAGVRLTIIVTLVSFSIAMLLGLLTAFGQMSKNLLIRNIAMLYVQIIRGVPASVLIF